MIAIVVGVALLSPLTQTATEVTEQSELAGEQGLDTGQLPQEEGFGLLNLFNIIAGIVILGTAIYGFRKGLLNSKKKQRTEVFENNKPFKPAKLTIFGIKIK